MLKKTFGKDVDGCCLNCGRPAPPCRCGELVTNRACTAHPEAALRVLAIPVRRSRVSTGLTEIVSWVDVAECEVLGCATCRTIKDR